MIDNDLRDQTCRHGYNVESAAGHNVCAELQADDEYLAAQADQLNGIDRSVE